MVYNRQKKMKKTLSFFAFLAVVITAGAQNQITPVDAPYSNSKDFNILPIEYSYHQIPYCYLFTYMTDPNHDDREIRDSIIFLDKNLQVYKRMRYDWGTTTSEGYTFRLNPIGISDKGLINDNCTFSQTLFNNDESFEFILPYSTDGQVTRFDIYNEENTVISSITWDAGWWFFLENDIRIVRMGDKTYLYFKITSRDNGNHYMGKYVFCRIDRQTQSITRVENVPFNVFPTVAERGNDITVQLEEGTNAREIVVVDAMGREVKSVPVAQGQREVKINTSDLGSGMGFVSDRKNGAVKIIVR